jgi:hypothetical protein
MAHGVYPAERSTPGPILNARLGVHHSWILQTLPYLEEGNAYRATDHTQSVYHAKTKRCATARSGYSIARPMPRRAAVGLCWVPPRRGSPDRRNEPWRLLPQQLGSL